MKDAKRAPAAGLPQRLKRCVAMCCDAQRRVAERYDAPRRVALPAVTSISPTRLIDNPHGPKLCFIQFAGLSKITRAPCMKSVRR